jgi:hypothetical protein
MNRHVIIIPSEAAYEEVNHTSKDDYAKAINGFLANVVCYGFFPKDTEKPQTIFFALQHMLPE